MCSEYGIEYDIKYTSTKSNVMTFSCKRFKDMHIPKLLLNGETLPGISKYKYLGHIITDIKRAMVICIGNTRSLLLTVML